MLRRWGRRNKQARELARLLVALDEAGAAQRAPVRRRSVRVSLGAPR
jgi:hypothetical protein